VGLVLDGDVEEVVGDKCSDEATDESSGDKSGGTGFAHEQAKAVNGGSDECNEDHDFHPLGDILSGLLIVFLKPLEPLECGHECWEGKQEHDDSCDRSRSEQCNTTVDDEDSLNKTEYTHDFHAGGNWVAKAAFKYPSKLLEN